jgi:hypothetical protein
VPPPERPCCERGHDLLGRGLAVDQAPIDRDLLVHGSGPFHIGKGDAPISTVCDRLQHGRVDQRRLVAPALHPLLVHVHAERDIDRGEGRGDA